MNQRTYCTLDTDAQEDMKQNFLESLDLSLVLDAIDVEDLSHPAVVKEIGEKFISTWNEFRDEQDAADYKE